MATTWWMDLKVVVVLRFSFADFNFHRQKSITAVMFNSKLAIKKWLPSNRVTWDKNVDFFAVFLNNLFPITDFKKVKNNYCRVFHAVHDGIFGLSIRRNHFFFKIPKKCCLKLPSVAGNLGPGIGSDTAFRYRRLR